MRGALREAGVAPKLKSKRRRRCERKHQQRETTSRGPGFARRLHTRTPAKNDLAQSPAHPRRPTHHPQSPAISRPPRSHTHPPAHAAGSETEKKNKKTTKKMTKKMTKKTLLEAVKADNFAEVQRDNDL